MKPNRLRLLTLTVATLAASPALAEKAELDMTMTIMEEGQEPAGFIQKITLPAPAEIGVEKSLSTGIVDQVREESGKLVDEATGTVTDNIKDVLSIEGAEDLPGDIVDNLSEDLPLLDDVVDGPDLPGLPLDSPQGELPLDAAREAGDTVGDTVEEGAGDVGSEVGRTLEETENLLP